MDRQNIILSKIKTFLISHIVFTEEEEIIYLLVQIRKVLELEDSKKEYYYQKYLSQA